MSADLQHVLFTRWLPYHAPITSAMTTYNTPLVGLIQLHNQGLQSAQV